MRDYAKKTSASQASFRRRTKQLPLRSLQSSPLSQPSRWPVYVGVLCVITLLALLFFRHIQLPVSTTVNNSHLMNTPKIVTQKIIAPKAIVPKVITPKVITPQYDFYQLLPKMTVEIPESNTESSTAAQRQ